MYSCWCLLAAMVLAPAAVWAEGAQPMIQTLPEDGAWAEYHVLFRVDGQELVLTWFLRSVGREQQGGVDCRWIELEERNNTPDRPQQVFKLLIPEDRVGPGRNPLEEPRRILYRRNSGEEVQEIGSVGEVDFGLPILFAGIPGTSERQSESEVLDWSRGRLECLVYTGSSQATIGAARIELRHRQLRSEQVPFGLAAMKIDFTLTVENETRPGRFELVLKDAGAGAQSVLP
jgi:hypothetical protein